MFYTAGYKASSTFFKVDKIFWFIIANAENMTSHKYAMQKGKNMYRVISEIVENYWEQTSKAKFIELFFFFFN